MSSDDTQAFEPEPRPSDEKQAIDPEHRLDEVIAAFLKSVQAGQAPPQQEWLARHPDLAPQLAEFFADRERMERLAEPVRAVVTAGPPVGTKVRYIGDYELLEELGRGGMGVVYKAQQTKLRRLVALKMILSGEHAGDKELARFRSEAEAVARLQHPHIVQIFEVGEHEGHPYFSLEYCVGGSLEKKLQGTPLPPKEAAQLLETLAHAIHAAHQAGVVHRDLKPANVLLTADGTPKIADFGLAKKLGDGAGPTASGTIMGTPSYMAPEQAGGKSKQIGPAADVYALGAILYEMLTGRPPFKAATPLDTVMQVINNEPVPPRQLQSQTPRDLETICLKCLQKEAVRRYESAETLADDLRRFLDGRPILARPAGALERTWRWCRRNPVVAGLITAVAASLLVGTGVATYFAAQANNRAGEAEVNSQRADRETEKAEANAKRADREAEAEAKARKEALVAEQDAREAQGRAEQEKARTETQLLRAETARYALQIGLAQREWQENNLLRAREILGACRVDLRGWEFDYLQSLCKRRMRSLHADSGGVCCVAFSPDGKRLATAGMGLGAGKPGQVKVWDVATGQETLALKFAADAGAVGCVAFSPDGKRLASGSRANPYKPGKPGLVKVWELSTGQEVFTLKGHSDGIASVAFSPDGMRLASVSSDGVRVWNTASGQEVFTFKGHPKGLNSVAFRSDGKQLASGSLDGTVKLWDLVTGVEILTLKVHTQAVTSVAFRPDGKHLASGSHDGTVKLWDLATGVEILTLKGHTQGVMILSMAFSPDGKRLASGSLDDTVKLWDLATGREVLTLKGHIRGVSSVAFSADGMSLATGSFDHTVNVWNLAMDESDTLKGHTDMVTSVAFSPDSKQLASASLDRSVKVWDVDTGEEAFTLNGHMGPVTSVAFSPDGNRLVSGGGDDKAGAIEVWDLQTRQLALTLKGHTNAVSSVAFSPEGQRLASASTGYGKPGGRKLKVWDLQMGREALPIWGSVEFPTSVAYSPDGKRLASAGGGFYSQAVQVWDAATGKEVLTLRKKTVILFGPAPVITSVCFSPDGRHLASARRGPGIVIGDGPPGEVTIWDLRTGQEVLSLKGHTRDVLSVVYHPEGRRLATTAEDKTVKIWDATTGQEVLSLKGHAGQVWSVAFSPDGKRLASAAFDGTVRIWRATR
jgi:WD40 repeat protein